MILYAASWGAHPDRATTMTEVLASVAATFPALERQAIACSSWSGSAHVSWVCSPSAGTSVADRCRRLGIVEGVAVRRRGGILSADESRRSLASRPHARRIDDIEGQFVVLDAGPDRLTVQNDALALLPLYGARQGDAWFVANRVEVLARLVGDSAVDLSAASTFLSVGWVTGTRTLSPEC